MKKITLFFDTLLHGNPTGFLFTGRYLSVQMMPDYWEPEMSGSNPADW